MLRLGSFALPLVPLGATTSDENRALADAIHRYDASVAALGARDLDSSLTAFLGQYPDSAWKPALLVDLGFIYRQTGHFSKALATWQTAWDLTRERTEERGRAVADSAAAQLSQLLAYLGRSEALDSLLHALEQRALRGTAAELINESSRGLASMRLTPGMAFKCGPTALARIAQHHGELPAKQRSLLQAAESTSQGFSLTAVRDLSLRTGMNYQMAFRTPGAPLLVPAVAHWKVGHFAALVAREGERIRVGDATFGEDIRMSPETIDAEASGYFLVPAGPLPRGYRKVSSVEGARVWGRGDTGDNRDNGATGAADTKAFGGPCPGGCTVWNVDAMVLSLSLHDVPLGYVPPFGPPVQFDVHYSQRDVQQPQLFNYGNLGRKWTTSWLSIVTDNLTVNGTADLYRRGGGNETFSFAAGNNESVLSPISQSMLTRIVDANGATTRFERALPDGSREIFGVALGTKYFMTQIADAQGNAVQIGYDDQFRITMLTDAAGQVTKLSYMLAKDPLKITQVTDPFGRSAKFSYTADGNLESLTDSLGIVSKYTYTTGDFISTLETPYGKTSFEFGDATTDKALGTTRFLVAHDALGRTSRAEFRQMAPGVTTSISGVPTGMATKNLYLQWRNTFVWNADLHAQQMEKGGKLDYTAAKIIHWLHRGDTSTASTSRVPESTAQPLEGRVWFDYPNQKDPLTAGMSAQPLHVGRVLDDGTTQLTSFEYNARGLVQRVTDPVGRQLSYQYADNGVDLIRVANTTAGSEQVLSSITHNDKHQPSSVVAANGSITHYEYNSHGQVSKVVNPVGASTTFSYDPRGYLVAIEGPDPAARVALTRDAVGRTASLTDATGATLEYEYDAADRLTKTKYPDGTTQLVEYNLLDVSRVTDRAGRVTQLTFDAERQLSDILDASGRHAQLGNSLDGKLVSLMDASGNTTRFTRDAAGRIVSKQFPDGTGPRFEYEKSTSRLLATIDPKGQTIGYQYNADDSLAALTPKDSQQPTAAVQFSYDKAYPRVVTMRDGTGETQFAYHPYGGAGAGQLASMSVPIAGANGVDALQYDYDLLGRLTTQTVAKSVETLTYDSLGRVTAAENALDTFSYGYLDATARVANIESKRGPKIDYQYYDPTADNLLRQIRASLPTGGDSARFSYKYDALQRVTAFAESYNGAAHPSLDQRNTKGALPPAADNSRTAAGRSGVDGGVLVMLGLLLTSMALAARRRISRGLVPILVPLMAASSCQRSLPVVEDEPVQTTPDKVGRFTQYEYDLASRLVSAVVKSNEPASPAPQYRYGYDANSNLTSIRADDRKLDQQYTSANSLSSIEHDANGNPQARDDAQYSWDGFDRLVRVARDDRQSEFSYDGLGRLVRIVERQVDKVVADHAYTWCGPARCLERDNLVDGSPVSKRYFGQGFVAGKHGYYYVADRLGSVRQLVDDRGKVRAQYDYEPYGKVSRSSGDVDSDLQFTGLFQHAASGLALALHRAYDPQLGRWLNRDPIKEAGGSNLYAYVGGDPINRIDPTGLSAASVANCFAEGLLVGLGSGLVFGVVIASAAVFLPAAVLTGGLALLGAAGAALLAVDVGWSIGTGDWDHLAFDVGAVLGGGLAGRALPGLLAMDEVGAVGASRGGPQYVPTGSDGSRLPLPRGPNGEVAPSSLDPHTQIGWQEGRRGGYAQTREFGPNGQPVKQVDWTDHGRPNQHTVPHVHDYVPNPTGGTPQHGPARPPYPGEF